jgi:hypothetical protein
MKTKSNNAQDRQTQPAAPRFPALCLLSACLMLAATGCKPAADVNANPDPAGVYKLVSVDGKTVPCDVTHEGVTLTVKTGVFTINADGTCHSQMTFSVARRGDMSRDVDATYTCQGAELTMQWQGAGMTFGNVHGNIFTMTNEDMVLAYRK